MKLFFVILFLALNISIAFGSKGAETIDLRVAFFGPDLKGLIDSTKRLLEVSGRKISDVKITSVFGSGRPGGALITHIPSKKIPAKCESQFQDFSVTVYQNFFSYALEVLGYIKVADKFVYNFEYTSFYNTGKPGAGRFHYCK